MSYRAVHGMLDVVWVCDDYVSGGHFLDVFMPIDGVNFGPGPWDAEDYAPATDAPNGWQRSYRKLQLAHGVNARVFDVTRQLSPGYSAIHIRRTDHVPNRDGNVESDGDFVAWLRRQSSADVYLATDNGETQKRWLFAGIAPGQRVRVGHMLPGCEVQGLTDHHRNGTLADAVVDLHVCAGAHAFMGSEGSSFSDTITILRGLR
jgi:hypothetical protein